MIARKNWLYLLSRSWSLFDYLPAEQSGQMRADAAQNGIDTPLIRPQRSGPT
jgi:hypothetical protein